MNISSNTTDCCDQQHRDEIIRISLGSLSNALSSHLSNLEGLSCTSTTRHNNNNTPLCHPRITHRESSRSFLPRAIFMDDVDNYGVLLRRRRRGGGEQATSTTDGTAASSSAIDVGGCWNGTVAVMSKKLPLTTDATTTPHHGSDDATTTPPPTTTLLPEMMSDDFDDFREMAQRVATTTSRYNVPHRRSSNERHVNWNDMSDDDSDDDDDDDENYRQRKKQHKLLKMSQMEQQLSSTWEDCASSRLSSSSPFISWHDYLLPPHPPPHSPSIVPLTTTSHSTSAMTNRLEDAIRILLEECDSLTGCQLLTDAASTSPHGDLSRIILEYFHDECRSARRWSYHVTTEEGRGERGDDLQQQRWEWLDRYRDSATFASTTELSHVTLPLHLPSLEFQSTALLSLSLHNLTLPYRIPSSSSDELIYYDSLGDSFSPSQQQQRRRQQSSLSFRNVVDSFQHFRYNVIDMEMGSSSSLSTLRPMSCPKLPSLTAHPQDERGCGVTPVYDYRTFYYVGHDSSRGGGGGGGGADVMTEIIQSYRPMRCTVLDNRSFRDWNRPTYAYWNQVVRDADAAAAAADNDGVPTVGLLSHSSRSANSLKRRSELTKRLVMKKWFWLGSQMANGMEEKEDALEMVEFLENLSKMYASTRRNFWGLGSDDDDDDEDLYFDDNED